MIKSEYIKRLKKLNKILIKKNKILITTHKRPDGDAFGSSLALKMYLKKIGKKTDVIYSDELDSNYQFLPGFGNNDFYWKGDKDYDLFVLCDAGLISRSGVKGELEKLIKKKAKKKLVIIDHHQKELQEKIYFDISIEEAATCKIIYDFFRVNNIEIDKDMAACLLTGIFTDTGGFLHANTSSEIMKTASKLMEKGAVLSTIAKKTFFNKSYKTIKIWGKALKRASLKNRGKVAYSYITLDDLKECNAKIEDLSGVTNILGAMEESRYSIFLAQTQKDKVKGSLRSEEYKKCNVSNIARKFNGGGHPLASGFELKGKLDPKKGIIN